MNNMLFIAFLFLCPSSITSFVTNNNNNNNNNILKREKCSNRLMMNKNSNIVTAIANNANANVATNIANANTGTNTAKKAILLASSTIKSVTSSTASSVAEASSVAAATAATAGTSATVGSSTAAATVSAVSAVVGSTSGPSIMVSYHIFNILIIILYYTHLLSFYIIFLYKPHANLAVRLDQPLPIPSNIQNNIIKEIGSYIFLLGKTKILPLLKNDNIQFFIKIASITILWDILSSSRILKSSKSKSSELSESSSDMKVKVKSSLLLRLFKLSSNKSSTSAATRSTTRSTGTAITNKIKSIPILYKVSSQISTFSQRTKGTYLRFRDTISQKRSISNILGIHNNNHKNNNNKNNNNSNSSNKYTTTIATLNSKTGYGTATFKSKELIGKSGYIRYNFSLEKKTDVTGCQMGQLLSICCLNLKGNICKGDFYIENKAVRRLRSSNSSSSRKEEGCFSIIVPDVNREREEFGNDHDNEKLEGSYDESGRGLVSFIVLNCFCYLLFLLFFALID